MRKNILILAHSPGSPFTESCNQYVQLFDRADYEVTVAYLVEEETDSLRQKNLAENVLFMNCSRAEIRGLKIGVIRRLLKLCREKKFDVVICHRYKPTYLMLWVSQFVLIPHLFFVMHAIGTMDAMGRKLLVATLFRKNMFFVGVSNAVRDDLRCKLLGVSPEKVITLHNIIDHDEIESQLYSHNVAREKLQLDKNTFIFGHMGRLTYDKDQKSLLQAFSLIHARCQSSQLVIIGGGKLEGELKNQAHDLGLENSIRFMGHVPDGFRYMRAFDVFILCSVKESFGRVLLEAMVARIPMIGTRIFGIPEVVGESGVLVDAKQPKELANAMLAVFQLSQTERDAFGEKGYQRMRELFSIEVFRKKFWESLYSHSHPTLSRNIIP